MKMLRWLKPSNKNLDVDCMCLQNDGFTKPIISEIIGGLGNQMFQYAAGRSLAHQTGNSHLVDLSRFNKYRLHNGFQLQDVFNCKISVASENQIRATIGYHYHPIIRKIFAQKLMARFRSNRFIVESESEKTVLESRLKNGGYLSGFWQNERYFKNTTQLIKKEFSFKNQLDIKNKCVADLISQKNSVSIHVRRGDYVSNAVNRSVYAVCDVDYYRSAVKTIVSLHSGVLLVFFSDDLKWVRENLNLPYPSIYVDHNRGFSSYNDMRLMSLCNHNIIANSSFSWWGAWLNTNPNKIVIAPRKWYNKPHRDFEIIPSNWVKI